MQETNHILQVMGAITMIQAWVPEDGIKEFTWQGSRYQVVWTNDSGLPCLQRINKSQKRWGSCTWEPAWRHMWMFRRDSSELIHTTTRKVQFSNCNIPVPFTWVNHQINSARRTWSPHIVYCWRAHTTLFHEMCTMLNVSPTDWVTPYRTCTLKFVCPVCT